MAKLNPAKFKRPRVTDEYQALVIISYDYLFHPAKANPGVGMLNARLWPTPSLGYTRDVW